MCYQKPCQDVGDQEWEDVSVMDKLAGRMIVEFVEPRYSPPETIGSKWHSPLL